MARAYASASDVEPLSTGVAGICLAWPFGGKSEFLLERQPDNRATLVGIAFDTADLVLLQAWAVIHEMRMAVELDHYVDGHEYEEIVVIYAKPSGLRRWNLWRSWDSIVVQPIIGRSMRFGSVTAAIKAMSAIDR